MAFDVHLSEDTERDIEDIYRYIAGRDGTARAEAVFAGTQAAWESLAVSPTRGNVPKELWSFGTDEYREVHFKPYRIVYAIRGRKVVVHCILDGRRDMRTLLQRRLML